MAKRPLNILIVGSRNRLNEEPKRTQFQTACENVMKWIVPDHCAVFAGTTDPTADYFALNQFLALIKPPNAVANVRNVKLFTANNDRTHKEAATNPASIFNQLKKLPGIDPQIVECRITDWDQVFKMALDSSDFVLALGGGEDTAEMLNLALDKQLPILTFAYFDYPDTYRSTILLGLYAKYGLNPQFEAFCLDKTLQTDAEKQQFLDLINALGSYCRKLRRRQEVHRQSKIACVLLAISILLSFIWLYSERIDTLLPAICSVLIGCLCIGILISVLRQVYTWKNTERRSAYPGLEALGALAAGIQSGVIGSLITKAIAMFLNLDISPGQSFYYRANLFAVCLTAIISIEDTLSPKKITERLRRFAEAFHGGRHDSK